MYDVSIVIPTFRRPELLRLAVESCLKQTNELRLRCEIVVVDNSPEESARPMVEKFAKVSTLPITYVSAPKPNISLARNAGLERSRAPLVAFLDDDEQASPAWLDHMVRVQRQYDADVVFGPVVPSFEAGNPPPWDPECLY